MCEAVVTFLGCGKLATAVLSGILTTASTPGEEATEAVKSGSVRFNACVSSRDSAARLRETFAEHPDKVTVLEKHNLRGVREASIVVLGCKPVVYQSVLAEGGMREALDGKLLLSMLAGVSSKQITDAIYGVEASHEERTRCKVLRAIPSVAASIRNSTTVIEQSPNIEHKEASSAAESLFLRIGRVKFLPSDQIEVGAVLAASTPAFFALLVNAVAQGGVDQGMEKTLALELAAGAMSSSAEMILSGLQPSEVRRRIATSGGSTEKGLNSLEENKVDQLLAEAVGRTAAGARALGSTSKSSSLLAMS